MSAVDEFGHHEVLHTTHIIECMWSDFILKNKAVATNSELKGEAERIAEAIGSFYLTVGRVVGEKF